MSTLAHSWEDISRGKKDHMLLREAEQGNLVQTSLRRVVDACPDTGLSHRLSKWGYAVL